MRGLQKNGPIQTALLALLGIPGVHGHVMAIKSEKTGYASSGDKHF